MIAWIHQDTSIHKRRDCIGSSRVYTDVFGEIKYRPEKIVQQAKGGVNNFGEN